MKEQSHRDKLINIKCERISKAVKVDNYYKGMPEDILREHHKLIVKELQRFQRRVTTITQPDPDKRYNQDSGVELYYSSDMECKFKKDNEVNNG